jgi:hypothetical protein
LVVPQLLDAEARLAPAETSSDGLAIETHVLARLLGLKLLTLEGRVLVSPAAVHAGRTEPAPPRQSVRDRSPRRGRNGAGRGDGAVPALPNPRPAADPGVRLAAAARLVNECSRELRR